MKKFEKPVFAECSEFTEGIYASSGWVPVTPPDTPKGDWVIECDWANHNSGSHSELKIKGHNYGNLSGDCLTMHFRIMDFRLDTIKDMGGMIFSNISESGFTITRNNHFNPNENFEFNIQITCKNSPYEGSVGKTGEYCPHKVHCVSYFTA